MKILGLSLLRIGDILMHREVLQSVRAQYPQAEIHLLINEQFQSVQDLVPEVQTWKFVPRTQLQEILVKRNQSAGHAHEILSRVVTDLNLEKYDLVLNLTNNFLSVRLMDLIEAKEKRGSAFSNGRKVRELNRWQSYLNDHFSVQQGSRFHYVEVLSRALGFEPRRPLAAKSPQSNKIYFQLLTSDKKKNWGLGRFQKLIQNLKADLPQFEFIGLCSPAEREMVEVFFQSHEIVSPGLSEAAQLLSEARLLVTGDTSLLHLAAQARCETVSLFLGSADPVKTSAWQKDSTLISARVACAPCVHSSPCSQRSHLCAEEISVQQVTDVTRALLTGSGKKISSSAQSLEKLVWFNYLENENRSSIPAYASVARENPMSVSSIEQADAKQAELHDACVEMKICIDLISRALLVDQKAGNRRALADLVQKFTQNFSGQKDFVQQLHWALEIRNEFEMIKNVRKAWLELSELIEIRGKILREARGLYVREPRATQEHSAET